MSRVEFLMPDVGEGLTEADIVEWKISVGDVVTLNQALVLIETEKAAVELPSPYAGTITELRGAPGDTVAVGSPIVVFEIDGADGPVAREAVLVGYGVTPDEAVSTRHHRRRALAPPATTEQSPPSASPLSTPPVRLYAREHGVNLNLVTGTGRSGVITRADVNAALNELTPRAVVSSSAPPVRHFNGVELASWQEGPLEERIPVKGVVKVMAESMTKSAFTAPHACVWLAVDVTKMTELVRGLKARSLSPSVRITPMTMLAMAMLDGARHFPGINSEFDAAQNEIVVRRSVNLGIASDTPRGLIVPNVKGADQLSLSELATALTSLVETARAGTTTLAAMANTTLTITNVGPLGVDAAMPILPPGTGAIMAMGHVRRAPWVEGDSVVVRDVVELAMSFDHRMIDGALASQYLAHVGAYLHDPAPNIILGS